MLKLFFSALSQICIRAREDTKNRKYYNGWHIERTVERGNKITVFPSWLWILSSQVWTFLRSIDGRGGCWLSGKLWGAAPQRLGAHSEWVTPLLAGDHSTHWDPRQATIRTRWGRSYTSKPANAATRSGPRYGKTQPNKSQRLGKFSSEKLISDQNQMSPMRVCNVINVMLVG